MGNILPPTSSLNPFYAQMEADQSVMNVRIFDTGKHSVFVENGPGFHVLSLPRCISKHQKKLPYKSQRSCNEFYLGGPEVKCHVSDESKEKETKSFFMNFDLL